MNSSRFVVILGLLAALHAILWTCVIPPGHGGDEEGHFAYVEFLVWKRKIPVMHHDFNMTRNYRAALNKMNFALVRLNPFARPEYVEIEDRYPPDEMEPGTYICGAAAGPPLYYILTAPAAALAMNHGVIDRLYAARLAGAFLAAATAILGFLAVRLIVGDGTAARTTGWILALQPQAHFILGCVTSDAGTLAAVALCLWIFARLVRSEATQRVVVAAGLAAAAAYLMKPFAGSMLLVLLMALLVHGSLRSKGRNMILAGTAATLSCLPWLVWAFHFYGGPSGFSLFRNPSPDPYHKILLDALKQTTPWTLFSQSVGVFGHLDAPLPLWIRLACAVVFTAGWLRFAWLAVTRKIGHAALLFAAVPIAHTAFVFAARVWTTTATGYAMGLQGRYFFLPLAAWILPAVIGLHDASWPPAVQRRMAYALRLGALLLALHALGWTALPRYFL